MKLVFVGTGGFFALYSVNDKHRDKNYSLCDALSFVLCERLGIDEAIACDDDFRSYGRLNVLL